MIATSKSKAAQTLEDLAPSKLMKLASARLEDAKVLFNAKRYDGAFYICGYAVEMGLKHKICKTLDWDVYPAIGKGSEKYKSFKTHDLQTLFRLSGAEKKLKTVLWSEWSTLTRWNSEIRYSSEQNKSIDVEEMIKATEALLGHL